MWKYLPVEFLNGLFRHVCSVCVVGFCHAEESLHAVDQGVIARLLPPDGELLTIAFSSDGLVPLKQFIINNPLHIPPDGRMAAPSAECHSFQNCLA
jgi:hypothetical protein